MPPRLEQAKALYAALAHWNTLEVSTKVDRAIVTRLLSRSGRILAGISSNMGITLLVEREKGVLRGRARTAEEAKEANRVLKQKVGQSTNNKPKIFQNCCSVREKHFFFRFFFYTSPVSFHRNAPILPPGALTPPPPPLSPYLQVMALSQRRSEQTYAAGTTAPAPKASVLSRGHKFSTHSQQRSSMSDGVGLELTDAFEELQAFFEGGTLLDRPTDGRIPTSSTKVSASTEGLCSSVLRESRACVCWSDLVQASRYLFL